MHEIQIPIPTDPLGEALHILRMSGTFYCRCEFTAPWGLILPEMPGTLMFHVVVSGRCWIEVDGAEPRQLQPGDLALVPHGEGHRMASEPGEPGVDLFALPRAYLGDRYEVIRQGGGGAPVTLLCGAVAFDQPAARNLIDALPRLLSVDAADSLHAEWMQSTLRFIVAEARHLRPGGEAIITRLADVLVIQAIRAWIEQDPSAQSGWLQALRDPQIGHAMTLIHRDPGRPWTVASLAHEVAMSRSAFAARFAELAGESPMHYVTRWRMQIAASALREGTVTVGELAAQLGYHSEAAFSRAFKRFTGRSPGAVRRANDAAGGRREPAPSLGQPLVLPSLAT